MNQSQFQQTIANAWNDSTPSGAGFGITPELEQAIAFLGQTELQMGNYPAAARIYGGLVAHFYQKPAYWGQIGHAFMGMGDAINAFTSFGMAEALSQNNPEGLDMAYNKILCLTKGKYYMRAVEYGMETIENTPNGPAEWRAKMQKLINLAKNQITH